MSEGNAYSSGFGENVDPEALGTLAKRLTKITQDGLVSRKDVEPYIEHFPVSVGLDDFDEQPSTRNVAIATESMAAFLKLGLAIAVVGAVGYILFNLVTSRKRCERIESDDSNRAILFTHINSARQAVINSPAWLNTSLVGANGMPLQDALWAIVNEPILATEFEEQGRGIFARSFYDESASSQLAVRLGLDQFAERLSQQEPIKELRSLLDGSGERIQHGDAIGLINDIQAIHTRFSIERFNDRLASEFSKQLPKLSRVGENTDGELLNEIVAHLEKFYEIMLESDVTVVEKMKTNVATLGTRHRALPASSRDISGDIVRSTNAIRGASKECEKLKSEAKQYHMSPEVENAVSGAIDEIKLITGGADRLLGLVDLETTSALAHAKWMGKLHVNILVMVENFLKHNNESSSANRVASARKELERVLKKTF